MRRLAHILVFFCVPALRAPGAEAEPVEGRSHLYEISHPDLSKSFDLRLSSFGNRSYEATASSPKTRPFFFWQKTQSKEFSTREFQGTKSSWLSKLPFFTKSAEVKGKHTVPDLDKTVPDRTVSGTDLRYASKAVPVRALPGGNRPYLGPETERAAKPLPPTRPPEGWQGNLTEIKTLEEVRELLNKNK
jgi:hypothetical protein